MRTTYVSNAFSLSMLPSFTSNVEVREVKSLPMVGYVSGIGHKSLIPILEKMTGHTYPESRINIHLQDGDVLYVAQYTGKRLEEGATELPDGASLSFLRVVVIPQDFFITYDFQTNVIYGTGTSIEESKEEAYLALIGEEDPEGQMKGLSTVRCEETLYREFQDGVYDPECWSIDPETGMAYVA
jgi:hypothetical protein